MDHLNAQKDGLPEDDYKKAEKEVQKITDQSIEQINNHIDKEEDLEKSS